MGRVASACVAAFVLTTAACASTPVSDSTPITDRVSLDEPVLSEGVLPRPEPDQPIVIQAAETGTLQIGLINNKVVTLSDESPFRFAV
jgi:hypothetical protein